MVIRPLALIGYLVGVSFYLLLIILPVTYLLHHSNSVLTLVALLLIALVALSELVLLSRLPLKITLSNSVLATWGLRGKKVLPLAEITSTKVAGLTYGMDPPAEIFGGLNFKNCLLLTGRNGQELFIHLGALSQQNRRTLREPLLVTINKPEIQKNDNVTKLLKRWYD
jgi:hypothetical protein